MPFRAELDLTRSGGVVQMSAPPPGQVPEFRHTPASEGNEVGGSFKSSGGVLGLLLRPVHGLDLGVE